MATSKFLRLFLTNAAEPLLGATIYLVPQANSYPTGAILLTAHPTRAGMYQADGIAHGEYKIYIGSETPVLYTEHIWVGENFITIIADKFDVATGQLTTAGIKDLAVTTGKIANSAVTATQIADNAVTTGKVVDNAITTGKIVNGAITTSKLGDGSIVATKFDPGAVTAFALDDGAVTESKVATGAVTETKVGTGAITATKIASNAVTSDKIINAAVTDSKIANGAVTELKLATDSVSTSKILNDAVTKAKLNPDVIGVDGLLAQNVDGSLKVDVDGVSLGLGYGYQLSILDDGVDKSHINANVAGAGLGQNLDGSLEVKTDGVSLEVVSDQLRLKRKEIQGILQFSGGGRSFSSIYNSAGVTLSVTREDVGVYSFTASGSVFTVSKTLSFIQALVPAQVHIGVRRHSDTVIRIESEDSSGAAVDLVGDFYLTVVVFP
jgi:hypothetical protein